MIHVYTEKKNTMDRHEKNIEEDLFAVYTFMKAQTIPLCFGTLILSAKYQKLHH